MKERQATIILNSPTKRDEDCQFRVLARLDWDKVIVEREPFLENF
jgi:hypothetical protein